VLNVGHSKYAHARKKWNVLPCGIESGLRNNSKEKYKREKNRNFLVAQEFDVSKQCVKKKNWNQKCV
jgi:hypothetical protein